MWDFRALDGPMYSGFAWSTMSHGDCAREAARHGFNAWSAFAFGNTYPVPPGATFLATPGGVIQIRPPGEAPLWYGTLLSRLNTRTPWAREVTLPHNRSDRPVCVLHHDSLTLYSRARFPEGRARETIAGFVDRQEHTAIFSTPLGRGCGHLSHHGVECRDVLGGLPAEAYSHSTRSVGLPGPAPDQPPFNLLVLGGWPHPPQRSGAVSWCASSTPAPCFLPTGTRA